MHDNIRISKTILLVNPPIYDFAAFDLFNKPLGLLYVGAFLRQYGYDVRLVDCLDRNHPALPEYCRLEKSRVNGAGKYYSEVIDKPQCLAGVKRLYRRFGVPAAVLDDLLEREYRDHKPAAVLVGSMMTYWYEGVADTIARIRCRMPGVAVLLGGVYANLAPAHARERCRADETVVNLSMSEILQLVDRVAGVKRDYVNVAADFPSWPVPIYDLYEKLDYLMVITSVGCPYNCDYCASRILQPQLQMLEPDDFVGQLTELLGLLGRRELYNIAFMDDALLANAKNHIIPILQKIMTLKKPLRFHCPNGLHCRFVTGEVARLMYGARFEMIRLSYESSDDGACWQAAGDNKVCDEIFRRAVKNLQDAGYKPSQIEAYILTGLPGQRMEQIESSAAAVHNLGVKVRLCQYTPIPKTKLFNVSCESFGVDPNEPLLHNNSILSTLDRRISQDEFQRFKNRVHMLNNGLQ